MLRRSPWGRVAVLRVALLCMSSVSSASLPACTGARDLTEMSTSDAGAERDATVEDPTRSEAGSTDDVFDPEHPAPDRFDPAAVHLFVGAHQQGTGCFQGALTRWSEPRMGHVGLPCEADSQSLQVDANTGRVVYRVGPFMHVQWREFRADSSWAWTEDDYPSDVESNDVELPTSECPFGAVQLMVRPEGGYLYQCEANTEIFTAEGERLAPILGQWLSVSFGALALVMRSQELLAVELSSGLEHLVRGPQAPASIEAVRASRDGFHVVVSRVGSAGSGVVIIPELWIITRDGVGTLAGLYTTLPIDASGYTGSVLDAEDALVGRADVPRPIAQHALIRRRATATGGEGVIEVLYGLRDSFPSDRIEEGQILKLFTGP